MTDDEREIRDLVRGWLQATRDGDVDTVLAMMAEDAVFLVPGQPPMRKADFAAAARAAQGAAAPRIEACSDIQEIRVAGDWAFVWSHLEVSVTPPGRDRALRRAGHTLSVLQRLDGRWRLARDANLLVPVAG